MYLLVNLFNHFGIINYYVRKKTYGNRSDRAWSHLNLSYLIINEHFNNYSTKSGEEKGKQTLG